MTIWSILMDNNFPKIMSEQYRFDMGPWLCEKTEAALETVIDLIQTMKGNIPDKKPYEQYGNYTTLQELFDEAISGVLWDLTKIYSFSTGGNWDPSDRDIISTELNDGLEKIQKKYGLIDKTQKEEKDEKYKCFLSKLNELLSGGSVPNRTFVNELFDKNIEFINQNTIQGRILKNIEKELDKVNLGETTWEDFVISAKDLLRML
jgi:hypothetical protein